jgi:hypothetical protein
MPASFMAAMFSAAVHAVGAAGAQQVLAVVSELRAALAELVEGEDVLGLAEVLGILDAHDDGALAGGLGAVEVGRRVHRAEEVRISCAEALPGGHEAKSFLDRGGPAGADRVVEAGDAAFPERSDLGLGQRVRVSLGFEVDLEHREHVDDERALDERDRARGVGGGAVREQPERGQVQHRKSDPAGRALDEAPPGHLTALRTRHHAPAAKIVPRGDINPD